MAWLLYEGQVIASVESRRNDKSTFFRSCYTKLRDVKGVLLINDVFIIHNLASPSAVDVVLLDKDFVVIKNISLGKNRFLFIGRAAKYILLASPKTLANYDVAKGDVLKITND